MPKYLEVELEDVNNCKGCPSLNIVSTPIFMGGERYYLFCKAKPTIVHLVTMEDKPGEMVRPDTCPLKGYLDFISEKYPMSYNIDK